MKKVVLYLEEIDLDLENVDNNDIEVVDEESEVSIISSHFVDGVNTDEYPSTGRMYVRSNSGNYVVRRIREANVNEASKIFDDEKIDEEKLLMSILDEYASQEE